MITPDVQTANAAKMVIESVLPIWTSVFSAAFMIVIAIFIFNALRKLDLTKLFTIDGTSEVSSTKFWTNIAYFIATIAFLTINFVAPGSASIEWIWIIYLGVVASSSIVTKFISARWGTTPPNERKNDPE